jgi:hypothetical protein
VPNITPYEAPSNLALNPTETGIDARLQSARRLGAYGSQIADTKTQEGREAATTITDVGQVVENDITHRDVSQGSAAFANFMAQKNAEWEDIAKKADPNDRSVQQKFLQENLEPALEQFKQGFSTERSQQWAEHAVDTYRQNMFEKTTATMSSLAGEAAKVNAAKTINGLSSAVAIDPTTHSIDNAFYMLDHSLGATVASSPNISATDAARVTTEVTLKGKEAIVKSAVSSMITKNPNIDLDAIQKKYGEYIDGAEMKMFQKAAQTQAKADLLQTKQLETYQRQQQERKANDEFSKVVTDNFSATSDGQLSINPKAIPQTLDVLKKYPEAGAPAARTMIDFVEAQQNKGLKAVDDPTTVKGLSDNLFSPDKPTTTLDLMKARAQGKISDHTFTVMNGLVKEMEETPLKGPIYQDTMKAAHSSLVLTGVGIPGKDDVGEKKYAQFVQNFIPQYLRAYRAGTLPPNALDVNDPKSMISQAMEPFKRTLTDRINDYVSTLGGGGDFPGSKSVAPAAPKTITTKAEYDALPLHTIYIGRDGQKYEKR